MCGQTQYPACRVLHFCSDDDIALFSTVLTVCPVPFLRFIDTTSLNLTATAMTWDIVLAAIHKPMTGDPVWENNLLNPQNDRKVSFLL